MDDKKDITRVLSADLDLAERVEGENSIELSVQQKIALDKELASIAGNSGYLQKWNDVRRRFNKQ